MRLVICTLMLQAIAAPSVSSQTSGTTGTMPHSHSIGVATLPPDSVAVIAARARQGVEAFRERAVAVDAGYKPVGGDFPSMGEHWLNTSLLYQGQFAPDKPAMLSYVVIDGRPVLTGAVFAVLLAPGELPPPLLGRRDMWHDHSGTLDDESALPVHDAAAGDTSSPRLMVLHAWVGVANPAGMFEADNWALPYLRAGVPVPQPLSISAARALSLLNGGIDFYTSLARVQGANPESVSPILKASSRAVESIAARMRASKSAGPADIRALESIWESALHDVAATLGPAVAARLNGGLER